MAPSSAQHHTCLSSFGLLPLLLRLFYLLQLFVNLLEAPAPPKGGVQERTQILFALLAFFISFKGKFLDTYESVIVW